MPDTPKLIQQRLIHMGFLDPPADGVIGAISSWALKAAGIKESVTAEHAKHILETLEKHDDLPLKPGDDFAGKIIKAMLKHHYWVARHKDCLNIVYVEHCDYDSKTGKFKKNAGTPNTFKDLRIVIRIDHGVPKIVGHWIATTEPGRYFTMKPMNPKGAARIAFGQYKAWSRGMHGGAGVRHEALVQTTALPVYRDPKKIFKRYGEKHTGFFGINMHHGYNLSLHDLGRSSAGCLVGRTTAGHTQFMTLVKSDARYKASGGSYKFMGAVIPAEDVVSA